MLYARTCLKNDLITRIYWMRYLSSTFGTVVIRCRNKPLLSVFFFSAWILWLRLFPAKIQEERPWHYSSLDTNQWRKPREENYCHGWSSFRGVPQHLWWRLLRSGHGPKVFSPRVADHHCTSCSTVVSATFCCDVWLSSKPGKGLL